MPPPSPLRRRPDPPARRRQQVLAEAPDQPGGKRIGERPVRRNREQRGSGAISHSRSRLRSPASPRGRRYRTTTPDGRDRTRAPPRPTSDRQNAEKGTSTSLRVDLGGHRILRKKRTHTRNTQ